MSTPGDITTHSLEEGLDFACQLLQNEVSEYGKAHPDAAPALLTDICFYIEFRYVGEPALALENLARIAHSIKYVGGSATTFWRQVRWVADEMRLVGEAREELRLPDSAVT